MEDLEELLEEDLDDSPAEPTLLPRSQSFSDYHGILRPELVDSRLKRHKPTKSRKNKNWEALALDGGEKVVLDEDATLFDTFSGELLDAGQEQYTLYGEQLAMTERHLDALIQDTNSALKLLASLSESFRGVEEQTTTFQAQCEDLLSEQRRLEKLADEVGTDLHYYAYLENVTRRLNAPGAGRLVEDESFGEILQNLDSCIAFMENNVSTCERRTSRLRATANRNSPTTVIRNPTLPAISHCSQRPSIYWKSGCRTVWTKYLVISQGRL